MFCVCCLLAVVGTAVPARAELYTWKDARGQLVVSDKPSGATPIKTYAVPSATTIRATRYVAPERARAYDDLIEEHARNHKVRPDLVRAVMQVESAFNPYARSPKGAMGLMQLMPATAKQYGVKNAFNPEENVRAGVAYLRELLDRFDENEELALAAYNAGPNAVDRYGQNIPPYRETQNYVAKISRLTETAKAERPKKGVMYKIIDIGVDGQPKVSYTDKKPATGAYEVIGGRP